MEAETLPLHKRIFEILKSAAKEFGVDRAGLLGAALSYYTIFSLVPLLFLLVAVAGFVFSDPNVVTDLVDQATEVAGEDVGATIHDLLATVNDQRGTALSIGLALAAYSASGIFLRVQAALGAVFHVPLERRRTGPVGWLIKRGIALGSAIVLAALAFTPIAAVGAIGWLGSLLPESLDWLKPILQWGVPVASLVMLVGVVSLSFQVLTAVEVPWKAAIRGGTATALVGLVSAFLVGMYLTEFSATGAMGALGSLAILLFFFGLLWTVYLFGAEVTKVYADYLDYGDVVQPSLRAEYQPAHAIVGRDDSAPAGRGRPVARSRERGIAAFLVGLLIGWSGRRRS